MECHGFSRAGALGIEPSWGYFYLQLCEGEFFELFFEYNVAFKNHSKQKSLQ